MVDRTDIGLMAVLDHGSRGAVLASGAGVLLLKSADSPGRRPCVVTMPVLDIVDVLVALGFGSAVLGERLVPFRNPADR